MALRESSSSGAEILSCLAFRKILLSLTCSRVTKASPNTSQWPTPHQWTRRDSSRREIWRSVLKVLNQGAPLCTRERRLLECRLLSKQLTQRVILWLSWRRLRPKERLSSKLTSVRGLRMVYRLVKMDSWSRFRVRTERMWLWWITTATRRWWCR